MMHTQTTMTKHDFIAQKKKELADLPYTGKTTAEFVDEALHRAWEAAFEEGYGVGWESGQTALRERLVEEIRGMEEEDNYSTA